MASYGLESIINDPTRQQGESSSCIDHVFCRFQNMFDQIIKHSVQHLDITDHAFIELAIFHKKHSNTHQINQTNNTKKKIDYGLFNDYLLVESWQSVYSESSPNIAFENFISIFSNYLSRCTHFVRIKTVRKLKPWISDSLVSKIKFKKKLYRKTKQNPGNSRFSAAYKKYSKKVNLLIKQVREDYYRRKFETSGMDVKKNWAIVDEILGKKTEHHSKYNLNVNGQIVSDDLVIANTFNSHFSEIAEKLRSAIPNNNMHVQPGVFFSRRLHSSFNFRLFSSFEVLKVINSLENKLSTDEFGISNQLIKHLKYNLIDILTYLFNFCVLSGIFPRILKRCVVVPIFKKGDKNDLNNYRPISLSPVFAKIFEKLLKPRLTKFVDKHELLSNSQYGFRAGKSTEDAMVDLLNLINGALDKKKYVSSLFLDISKAFDTIDRKVLLLKLSNMGFRGFFYDFLESYLIDRCQFVRINNTLSESFGIDYGVPQGSVLGPFMFLVYVNSIFEQDLHASTICFADDMVLIYASDTRLTMDASIKSDLVKLKYWMDAHYFMLSVKSKYMSFYLNDSRSVDLNPVIHSEVCAGVNCNNDCIRIEQVTEYKYLGVLVDSKLTWKNHINHVSNYSRLVIRKLFLMKGICSQEVSRMVYLALGSSKLQYGLAVWGSCHQTNFKPLYTLQKYMIRIITKSSRMQRSWPLFVDNKILPLRHQFVYKVLRIFFDRCGNRNVRYLSNYNIRSNRKNVIVPRFNTTLYRRSYLILAPIIFNMLPQDIAMTVQRKLFLRNLKKWLFTMADMEHIFIDVV